MAPRLDDRLEKPQARQSYLQAVHRRRPSFRRGNEQNHVQQRSLQIANGLAVP